MIYLKLNAEEAFEVLELLLENKEKRISNRLKSELIDLITGLNQIDQSKKIDLAAAWLKNQAIKIEELKKNDSK